ncbi:MAG: hypothetical protein JXA96_11635 [Sedimentisphaerales bacterium]|nr:hypothetical protein [Sedimentisphaerales bacterium]
MVLKEHDTTNIINMRKNSILASGRAKVKIIVTSIIIVILILLFFMKKQGVFGAGKVNPPELFSIFYTCDTSGHIEPCGCVGGMAGGLSRRQTYLVQSKPSDFLLVDAGDVTAGYRPWEILELEYILKGYEQMGYHAVNVGRREVLIKYDDLKNLKNQYSQFVSANLQGPDGKLVFEPFVVVKLSNGYRCGIIGILDDNLQEDEIGDGLTVTPPSDALSKYLPELKKKSDYIVLLAFADQDKIKEIAKQFFEVDVIVGGDVHQATSMPLKENHSILVLNTDKGKNVGRLNVRYTSEDELKYDGEIFVIAESMERDEYLAQLVEEYKLELKERQFRPLKDDEEGLSAISAMRSKNADKYIGPESCEECHEKAYKIWEESKHANAFKALEEKNDHYNPKCVQCHVVGYMASDGYISQELTPKLKNVSCESCHGRGDHHVKLESDKEVKIEQLGMKQTDCITCHDEENSPEFNEEEYWEKITHGLDEEKAETKEQEN